MVVWIKWQHGVGEKHSHGRSTLKAELGACRWSGPVIVAKAGKA